jgi:CMP/dCMP kinase
MPERTVETKNWIVIAVDGPAASGKGTIARRLAQDFDLAYLDTGAIYRAVAYLYAAKYGTKDLDTEKATDIAGRAQSEFSSVLFAKEELRSEIISAFTSKIAAVPEVRSALLQFQRDFVSHPPADFCPPFVKGSILDGRDIGSFVCPEAPLKLFVTASVEIRAKRRFLELQKAQKSDSYEAVLKDMQERDHRDQNRSIAPLKKMPDSYVLDNSNLSPYEAYALARDFVEQSFRHA